MANESKAFRIFYSWQSDLPEETNRKIIRQVLRGLRTPLEKKFGALNLDIEVDEATRKVAGSPNIPATIQDKIKKADVFVGDVSLVNQGSGTDPKKTPNPNVLFELGFAVAVLGWNRVFLLFNEAYGDAKFLPFDIDRHRVSPYLLKKTSNDSGKLINLCNDALTLIIEDDPPRPAESFDPVKTKRIRDLRQLTQLLRAVHWPTIEQHIEEAPKLISKHVLYFGDFFSGALGASTFHLYDNAARSLVQDFARHLHETTRFGHRYDSRVHSDHYVFTYSTDSEMREREEKDWGHIENELDLLRKAMRDLIKYIKTNYVELDVEDLSDRAWKRYMQLLHPDSQ